MGAAANEREMAAIYFSVDLTVQGSLLLLHRLMGLMGESKGGEDTCGRRTACRAPVHSAALRGARCDEQELHASAILHLSTWIETESKRHAAAPENQACLLPAATSGVEIF